jgi:hypothetical protein
MKLIISIFFLVLLSDISFGQTQHSYKTSSVEYISGMKSLYQFIQTKIVFPDSVKKGLIGGTVFVKLDIDSFGRIQKYEIIKGIKQCSQCDKEALRLIQLLPIQAFNPAIENNARIESTLILPFKFDIKKDSLIKYIDENLIGTWTFQDENYKQCNYCPDISFRSDKTADLIADKLSWTIENNKLYISDIKKPTRSNYFLTDSVYQITFNSYFKQLMLVGQQTTYKLTRK